MKKLGNYHKLLGVVTIINVVILIIRDLVSPPGSPDLNFLIYNLFLGFIPLMIALIFHFFSARAGMFIIIAASFLWLAFYPNAPYMVTDSIHINDTTTVSINKQYYEIKNPVLVQSGGITELHGQAVGINKNIAIYDSLIIFLFAMLSMFYGFFSIKIFKEIWLRKCGKNFANAAVILSILLSSLGIYVGRTAGIRLNTTDVFTRPLFVLQTICHCLIPVDKNLSTYVMIIIFSYVQFFLLKSMKDLEEPQKAG